MTLDAMLERPVLSVKQPWAHLLVAGYKDCENRAWPTKIRGWVWIHASKTVDSAGYLACRREHGAPPKDVIPRGAVVGLVRIVDCVRRFDSVWAEREQFQFVVDRARALPAPVAAKGRLGFWWLEPETRRAVRGVILGGLATQR